MIYRNSIKFKQIYFSLRILIYFIKAMKSIYMIN